MMKQNPKKTRGSTPKGAPAIKILITALSIVTILAGWAGFAQAAQETIYTSTTFTTQDSVPTTQNVVSAGTPPPTNTQEIVYQPTQEYIPVTQPVVATQPMVATKPQPQPTQPTLRKVSAPVLPTPAPAPVTMSRSSR